MMYFVQYPENGEMIVCRLQKSLKRAKAKAVAKGGVVYARKTDHGASEYPIGGIEADADSAKCEAVTGCYFMGAMDANGNVEVAFNI